MSVCPYFLWWNSKYGSGRNVNISWRRRGRHDFGSCTGAANVPGRTDVSGEIATGGATAAAEAGGGDFGSCTGAANVPGRTDVSGEIATGGATAAAEAGGGDFGSCTGAANVPGRTDVS